MGRRPAYRPLDVFMNGRSVGQMSRDPDGAHTFRYAADWLNWQNTMPISLSLPLREERYRGAAVIAVFENLLPDSEVILRRVAEKIGADGTDAYSLLAKIGRDCVGALQFLPAGQGPDPSDSLQGRVLFEAGIAQILRGLKLAPLGLSAERDFRISVAGAQEKTALLYHDGAWIEPHGTTPTTHILKPAIGALPNGMDMTDSVENEHFCLRLLASFGLAVAESKMMQFEEVKALSVTRFDRLRSRDGRLLRLPQEDCCQALSVPPSRKYQSEGGPGIVEITSLLRGSDEPQQDQADFFKAAVLFWLLAATDGHAKNFSIALRPGGRFGLTPLYDVLSVQPNFDAGQLQRKEMKLAMRAGKGRHYKVEELTGRHFVETGLVAGFSRARTIEIFEAILDGAERAFSTALAEMPDGFPQALAASIKKGFDRRAARLAPSALRQCRKVLGTQAAMVISTSSEG